jgi:surfeit locus 1 family protein
VSARKALIAIAALVGIGVTVSLGFWQWGRAAQKTALHEAMAQRQAMPEVPATALDAGTADAVLHRPITLAGTWVADRTVYLDNRQMQGRPGFYVVTPLKLADGRAVLVQRGWAPRDFQQRDRLPPVETPAGTVSIRGRLAPPPAQLYAFSREEQGAIRQNLDLERFRAETGLPLAALSVQQTGAASEGLQRDWPQPASGAEKNLGYAVQWWAIAATIAILYAWFQFIAPRRKPGRS